MKGSRCLSWSYHKQNEKMLKSWKNYMEYTGSILDCISVDYCSLTTNSLTWNSWLPNHTNTTRYQTIHSGFPSFTRTATSYGSLTPLNNSSVYCLTGSIQTSKGKKHTYHPTQKLHTGHPTNRRTQNQMIALIRFILRFLIS